MSNSRQQQDRLPAHVWAYIWTVAHANVNAPTPDSFQKEKQWTQKMAQKIMNGAFGRNSIQLTAMAVAWVPGWDHRSDIWDNDLVNTGVDQLRSFYVIQCTRETVAMN